MSLDVYRARQIQINHKFKLQLEDEKKKNPKKILVFKNIL